MNYRYSTYYFLNIFICMAVEWPFTSLKVCGVSSAFIPTALQTLSEKCPLWSLPTSCRDYPFQDGGMNAREGGPEWTVTWGKRCHLPRGQTQLQRKQNHLILGNSVISWLLFRISNGMNLSDSVSDMEHRYPIGT